MHNELGDLKLESGAVVVVDSATGLVWQQSGSSRLTLEEARKYIQKLNEQKFTGYSDWRLPTLEEAMSLTDPKKNEAGLHIDRIFDKTQKWIWTADKKTASLAWTVSFDFGGCRLNHVISVIFVRAVR